MGNTAKIPNVLEEVDLCGNMLSLMPLKLLIGALRKQAKIMLHNSLVTDVQFRNLLNNKKPGSKVSANMVYDNLMSLPLTPTVIFSQLSSRILCLDTYSFLSVRIWVQMLSSILSMESVQKQLSTIQKQVEKNAKAIEVIQEKVFPVTKNLQSSDCADQRKHVPSIHGSFGTEIPSATATHSFSVSGVAASPKLKAGAKSDALGASAQERPSDPVAMNSVLYSDGFGSCKR